MSSKHKIEYRLICVSSSRGLQQYTARLANALGEMPRLRLRVVGQPELLSLVATSTYKDEIPQNPKSIITFLVLARALFNRRPSVLHYQGVNWLVLILLYMAGLCGQRTILTPHNVKTHFPNRIYNAIKWIIWGGMDMIILHTKAELEQIPQKLRSRVEIIPHGEYVDLGGNSPVSHDMRETLTSIGNYVAAPGFIRDDKNIDYLIDHADVIRANGYDLVIAGRNLSSFPDARIAAGAKYFNGFVSDADLNELIRRAAAVVLPYETISESGILHQALSLGTPVIASDLSGFRERIKRGFNGVLLDTLDADSLDKAIKFLPHLGFDRNEIKNCHLHQFSWCRIAEHLVRKTDERCLFDE